MDTYLATLKTALERDLATDLFVVRRTVSYLTGLLDLGYITDIDTEALAATLEELNAFFDSDEVLSFQLEVLFVKDGEGSLCYDRNMSSLLCLKGKLEGLLEQKKEARRPLNVSELS